MEKLFLKSPIFLKNILFNLISYIENNKRRGKYYKQYLKEFKQFFKIDNSLKLKKEALKITKSHPFYKNFVISNFEDIPIINKATINENYNSFINENSKPYKVLKTSGTSGQSLTIPCSKAFYQKKFAGYDFFRKLNGLDLSSPNANFFGRTIFDVNKKQPPYWLFSRLSKQLVFSQYHLNNQTVILYLEQLEVKKIRWVHGYPSFLTLFCELIVEKGLEKRCANLKLSGVTTGSETLFPAQENVIKEVFQCEVFNFYGQGEGVADIFQYNKNWNINQAFSFVEFIHYKENLYHIVGTQLSNSCMPLLRYDTGDIVELDSKNNVLRIIGRIEDYIYLKDKTKIGRLDHIFKNVKNIIEAQIRQTIVGEAIFYLNVNSRFDKVNENELKYSIREKLGEDFNYEIVIVDHIEKTKLGKLKFVVTDIKD